MLAEGGIIISVIDLVSALVDDLSDRIFDGRNVSGNIVYVGTNHRLNLDSYTMRKQLGEAILVYSKQLQGSGKLSSLDERDLMGPGRVIDSLVKDTRPELFLEKDKPLPLDLEPPQIEIKFAGDQAGEQQFSMLDGDVYFNVATHDDSKVTGLRLIAPTIVSRDNVGSFGPIATDHIQDAKEIAKACGKKEEFVSQLKERNIKQENVICSCFEATDIVRNSK